MLDRIQFLIPGVHPQNLVYALQALPRQLHPLRIQSDDALHRPSAVRPVCHQGSHQKPDRHTTSLKTVDPSTPQGTLHAPHPCEARAPLRKIHGQRLKIHHLPREPIIDSLPHALWHAILPKPLRRESSHHSHIHIQAVSPTMQRIDSLCSAQSAQSVSIHPLQDYGQPDWDDSPVALQPAGYDRVFLLKCAPCGCSKPRMRPSPTPPPSSLFQRGFMV